MNGIGIRIYWGPWGCDFDPHPVVSIGSVTGKFQPFAPSIISEDRSWMIKTNESQSVYAFFSKERCTEPCKSLQLLVCVIMPKGDHLAGGKSPLDLLEAIKDQFGQLFTFNLDAPEPEVKLVNDAFGQMLADFPLERCPWYVFVMEGTEPASFCVESHAQLDALMRFNAYPALAHIEHLELGFKCKSTVKIDTKGLATDTSTGKKRPWWKREKPEKQKDAKKGDKAKTNENDGRERKDLPRETGFEPLMSPPDALGTEKLDADEEPAYVVNAVNVSVETPEPPNNESAAGEEKEKKGNTPDQQETKRKGVFTKMGDGLGRTFAAVAGRIAEFFGKMTLKAKSHPWLALGVTLILVAFCFGVHSCNKAYRDVEYNAIVSCMDLKSCRTYLQDYPDRKFESKVQSRLRDLVNDSVAEYKEQLKLEQQTFENVMKTVGENRDKGLKMCMVVCEEYIDGFPSGVHRNVVDSLISDLCVRKWIQDEKEAYDRIVKMEKNSDQEQDDMVELFNCVEKYIHDFPDGKHFNEMRSKYYSLQKHKWMWDRDACRVGLLEAVNKQDYYRFIEMCQEKTVLSYDERRAAEKILTLKKLDPMDRKRIEIELLDRFGFPEESFKSWHEVVKAGFIISEELGHKRQSSDVE